MAAAGKWSWYRLNFLSRMAVLLLVPTLFRWFNFAFLWHSIFLGAITMVVLIWGTFILLTPLFGRIGCGWFCFFGTIQDFGSSQAFYQVKHRRPIRWAQVLMITAFFTSAGVFHVLNLKRGLIQGWCLDPFRLDNVFDTHYKIVWLCDTFGVLSFGLLLHKRWMCKNLCTMGGLCAAGARHSRLLMTLNPLACTQCRKCERECPVAIPILKTADQHMGLVIDAECLLCGKCKDVCPNACVDFEFVWNRKTRTRVMEAQPGEK